MMMITMHSYRYLPFKTSLPRPKSLAHAYNGGASASCPVTQRVIWVRNRPSGYVSGQGLGIRAEHIHVYFSALIRSFYHDRYHSSHIQKFNVGKVKVSDLEFESSFLITMQQDRECHVSSRSV